MTMKSLFTILVLFYLMLRCDAEEASTYTSKYDSVNLDEILGSERLLNGYVNCLLELGPCTPDGKELKDKRGGLKEKERKRKLNIVCLSNIKRKGSEITELPGGGSLPDAIDNNCNKCTEKQREGSDKVMHFIIDHKPDDWTKLEKKYNSDGSYKKNYFESKKYKQEVIKLKDEANNTSAENKE